MRRLMLAAIALGLTTRPALAADPVEGLWLVQSKDAKVRIGPCPTQPDKLCGEIAWLQAPRAEKGRASVGMTLIRDFRSTGPGRWEGGRIYDPKSGKSYVSRLRASSDGTLKVDGCVLMVCQTQTWTKAG